MNEVRDWLVPSEEVISEIKNRAENGESVNSIKDDLGLPKSTVYYYFRKVVGQKQKRNQVQIPRDEEFRGELCGVFAGDGSFQHTKSGNYKIKFHLNSKERYWRVLKDFFQLKLSKAPYVCDSSKSKVDLLYNSKKLYSLFDKNLNWSGKKTYTVKLEDKEFSKGFKKGFSRGLMDTDGYRRQDHKRYVFSSASCGLRDDFYNLLKELDIKSQKFDERPRKEHYSIKHKLRITGEDVDKFNNQIAPRKPKRKY